jgi:hypothetical protein
MVRWQIRVQDDSATAELMSEHHAITFRVSAISEHDPLRLVQLLTDLLREEPARVEGALDAVMSWFLDSSQPMQGEVA